MKTLATTLALAAVALASGVCFADVQNRPVSGFKGIRLAVPAKLELIQGGTESFTIEGSAEDLAKVETVVEDGVLQIRRPKSESFKWGNWNPKFRITVNARDIDSLSISGSGDISAKALRAASLKLAISGSGDIRIPSLDAGPVTLAISGSGDMLLGGKATSVTSHISGSGDVKADRLDTRQAVISISGSGDVAVWARESLQVKIAGAGDVRYYGDPVIEKRIAGSGSVKRLGLAPS
jgi:hypothetical protein